VAVGGGEKLFGFEVAPVRREHHLAGNQIFDEPALAERGDEPAFADWARGQGIFARRGGVAGVDPRHRLPQVRQLLSNVHSPEIRPSVIHYNVEWGNGTGRTTTITL